MQVIELPDGARQLITDALNLSERPYPADIHIAGVTTLLDCTAKVWHRRRGDEEYLEEDPQSKVSMLLGTGYHAGWLPDLGESGTLKFDFPVRPGENATIMGFLDGRKDGLPLELKTTAASSKMAPNSHYIEQLAEYCWMDGKTEGYLAVVHLGSPKIVRFYHLVFTQEELDEWHMELTQRFADLLGDDEPDLTSHYDWQCRYCPRKGVYCPAPKGVWRSPFGVQAGEIEVMEGAA